MFKIRFISMLVLLAAVVTGARAAWTGGTYTATADENLGAITVNGDATLTINSDVTVTVTGGINVASGKTLTITGPGTLVVTGAKGNNGGSSGPFGSNGGNGGVAISGNIIVQGGATVQANGGAGGNGGAGNPDNGGHGANGAAAISGNVTVQGGATVTATGGNGGNGGNSDWETGGNGGNGGNAFAGTLTYKSGTVTANGGSGGTGGGGEEGGGSSGSAGKAFANDVDFTQTTGYSVTDGTSPIGSVLNQRNVVISGGTPIPTGYSVSLKEGTEDATSWTIAPAEATTTGVAAGTTVTATYNGTKKVKSVKAVKKAPAGPPSWKLTLSSPAKDLCIIANGGVIAQQTLDVASTEFTVEMPELTSQTVNIFATDGSGNCWYCTQENMSFAIGQTYQSSPTMTALDEDNSKPLYKITATSSVTIPDGKTVVLSGVNISGGSITCSGNATMILLGSNSVTATKSNAAIKIGDSGTTLTITGSGSLTATGGNLGAGIGTDSNGSGGNIVINGGTVTAKGGSDGAGIGTGRASEASITCGDITINGGTVTATGGGHGAGIGTGLSLKSGASNTCGAITIGTGVTMVTATKGSNAPNSIGKGTADESGTQTCGTITIGGTVYPDGVTTSPFTYEPAAE